MLDQVELVRKAFANADRIDGFVVIEASVALRFLSPRCNPEKLWQRILKKHPVTEDDCFIVNSIEPDPRTGKRKVLWYLDALAFFDLSFHVKGKVASEMVKLFRGVYEASKGDAQKMARVLNKLPMLSEDEILALKAGAEKVSYQMSLQRWQH